MPTITRDTSVEEPEAIKSYLQVQKSHMLTHIEGLVAYVGQLPAEKLAVAENSELPPGAHRDLGIIWAEFLVNSEI